MLNTVSRYLVVSCSLLSICNYAICQDLKQGGGGRPKTEIIDTWQFASPDRLVSLELQQGRNIKYYRKDPDPEDGTEIENWLIGKYRSRRDGYKLYIKYNIAKFSPYGYTEDGTPIGYSVTNIGFKATVDIEFQDANTIRASFDYDRNNFAEWWENETLTMIRSHN